ncbi:MAG: CRISPR-associated endoribonuclease Cas6, partial [Candidatus Thermoplasmatota archaeon]
DFFEITDVENFKSKKVRIGNGKRKTFRRCSLMHFKMHTSEQLKKFAYNTGLGEKNAMGFGCMEVVVGA